MPQPLRFNGDDMIFPGRGRSTHFEQFGRAVAQVLRPYRDELHRYDWAIDDGVLKEAEESWRFPVPHGASVFEQTASLRSFISARAHNTWDDPDAQFGFAAFVIRRWGGLKANSDDTIREFAARFRTSSLAPGAIKNHGTLSGDAPNSRGLWTFDGIASWSKWLNFLWPEWALIYDARIAFGLNAIHFLQGLQTPVFPQPVGRNALLSNLDAEALAVLRLCAAQKERLPSEPKAMAKWFKEKQFPRSQAYPAYLEVMRTAHALLWSDKDTEIPLVHTEMLLFRVSAHQLAVDFAGAVVSALGAGSAAPELFARRA